MSPKAPSPVIAILLIFGGVVFGVVGVDDADVDQEGNIGIADINNRL